MTGDILARREVLQAGTEGRWLPNGGGRKWSGAAPRPGFPGGSAGLKICLPCWRHRFDPWVGKIPGRRK